MKILFNQYVEKSPLIIRDDSVVNCMLEVSGSILAETLFFLFLHHLNNDWPYVHWNSILNSDSFIKRSTYKCAIQVIIVHIQVIIMSSVFIKSNKKKNPHNNSASPIPTKISQPRGAMGLSAVCDCGIS